MAHSSISNDMSIPYDDLPLVSDAQPPLPRAAPAQVGNSQPTDLPDLGDAEALRQWLTAAGVDVRAVPLLPNWNALGTRQEPQHRRLPCDFDDRVDEVLEPAFRQAVQVPFGAAVLCCYVRQLCIDTWKCSYHFDRMWATLRGAQRWWTKHRTGRPADPDVTVGDAAAALLEVLDWEIAIENEMIGNNPERLAAVSRRATQSACAAIALAEAVTTSDAVTAQAYAIAAFVAAEGVGSRRCDLAMIRAGAALSAFFGGRQDPATSLDDALADLREAERGSECDRDQRSELRGYRKTLERLIEHRDDYWLHIDEGNIVHLYPFAVRVRGLTPNDVVAAVRRGDLNAELAGIRPVALHQTMELDDCWNGSDALGRRFDGAVISLPDVTIADLDGRPLGRMTAELRFSELGNHYLRLEMELHDNSAHDVYTGILFSAPEHAEVQVRCVGGDPVWPRLSALAVDLVEAVGARLGESAAVSVRPGMFHVMVTVLEASAGRGPRAPRELRSPMESADELLKLTGGQVLVQPVPHIIGAPAEWIHYDVNDDVLLDVGCRDDEVVTRTCNTTLIASLGSPGYWINTRLQPAEFAASLDGLFAGWFDELAIFFGAVTRPLDKPEAELDIEELTQQAEELEREQVRLHTFAADARATLDLIRSPALMASPLVARALQTTLAASGFAERTAELTRNIDAVLDERLGRRLDTLVRQRREREAQVVRKRERSQRARLEMMLAIIAAMGISGLGQILQAGFDWKRMTALYVVVAIVAIGVIFGIWFNHFSDPEPGDRPLVDRLRRAPRSWASHLRRTVSGRRGPRQARQIGER